MGHGWSAPDSFRRVLHVMSLHDEVQAQRKDPGASKRHWRSWEICRDYVSDYLQEEPTSRRTWSSVLMCAIDDAMTQKLHDRFLAAQKTDDDGESRGVTRTYAAYVATIEQEAIVAYRSHRRVPAASSLESSSDD
jgi:hypothetical protein